MLVEQFRVDSPNVVYGPESITSNYTYDHTEVERTEEGQWTLKPKKTEYTFETSTRVPKLGCAAPQGPARQPPQQSSQPSRRRQRVALLLQPALLTGLGRRRCRRSPTRCWPCLQGDAGGLGRQQRDHRDWRHPGQQAVSVAGWRRAPAAVAQHGGAASGFRVVLRAGRGWYRAELGPRTCPHHACSLSPPTPAAASPG